MTDSVLDRTEEFSHHQIQEYYGKILSSKKDLKTSACCSTDSLPPRFQRILKDIQPEILEKSYGCGSPLPHALEGCTVLDLGCGTGRDVYMAARLAGPDGFIIGVDMTPEQLEVARRNLKPQMERFGYAQPNVDFRDGFIEDLTTAGIEDNSVDVVISNCVINLSPRKDRVFAEIFRVLKPGGELYFSDVFADRRLSAACFEDQVLHGECLGGAMYSEDFRRLLQRLGCPDYRIMSASPIEIGDPEIRNKTGNTRFTSVTVRAFKLASLEDRCEDYGQVVVYKGTVSDCPHAFILDDHHTFETNRPHLVCGNTAAMIQETRFGRHFRIDGDRSIHFGLFDCAPAPAPQAESCCDDGGCC